MTAVVMAFSLCRTEKTMLPEKVKKLINEKIPPQERASLHFIEDDEGTIFAEKLGIAGRVAPDGDTRRFLRITVVRER